MIAISTTHGCDTAPDTVIGWGLVQGVQSVLMIIGAAVILITHNLGIVASILLHLAIVAVVWYRRRQRSP